MSTYAKPWEKPIKANLAPTKKPSCQSLTRGAGKPGEKVPGCPVGAISIAP